MILNKLDFLIRFFDYLNREEKLEEYKYPLESILASESMKIDLEERRFQNSGRGFVKFSARIKFLVPSKEAI